MRGSNLDIQIGANSDTLRADLALAQAALRNTTKEYKALAAEAAKTGDRSKLEAITPKLREQEQAVASLGRQWRATSGEVGAASQSFTRAGAAVDNTSQSLRAFSREISGARRATALMGNITGGVSQSLVSLGGTLGALAGGFVGAFAGTAVAGAIAWFVKSVGSVADQLKKLQDTALGAGVPPIVMQAVGEAAKRAGLDVDVGTKSLETFSKALDAARVAAEKNSIQMVNGMAMVVPQYQQGAAVTRDWSNSLEALGLNLRKFPDTPQGKIDAYRAAIEKALSLEARFPSEINRLSQDLFGAPIAMIRAMAGDVAQLDALINKLMQTNRGATDPVLQALGALKIAQGQVGTAFQEMTASYQVWLLGQQAAANAWLAQFIEQNSTLEGLQANFARNTQAMLDALLAGWTSFWSSVQSLAQTTLDWISRQTQAVVSAIQSALSAVGSAIGGAAVAGAPVGPSMASGGYVRGPGSGTSDSILARLSNGEFVMRAAAVDRWGPQFMAALNNLRNPFGFAAGGMVGMPAFADGGMVGGGGSTPVHLHLGGHEFRLSGVGSVVDSLVSHARQQQMRSSGVKPSWYGGRPNN